MVDGWAMEAICQHLEAVSYGHIQRLLINVPPGFSKSLLTDVFWPAWEWSALKRPDLRYVTFSYSAMLTERDNGRFRNLLLSPKFIEMYGEEDFRVVTPGVTRISNNRTGWKFASSVGGVATGERGDRIVCLPSDQRILTSSGWLMVGDIVRHQMPVTIAGLDHATGNIAWQDIEAYETNPGDRIVQITWDGGAVRCTPDHPVFISGRGYVRADAVRAGDTLLELRGSGAMQTEPHSVKTRVVRSVEPVGSAPFTYNLRVSPHHNYFAEGALLHNCDDPHSVKDSESVGVREETVRWFREAMSNRLNNMETGAIVIIMQRVNEGDVAGSILDTGMDYVHLCIPMEYDPDRHCQTPIWEDPRTELGEIAWPERFSEKTVGNMKTDLGPYAYAAQYQQMPAPRGGGIIKRDWWQLWEPEDGKWPQFDYLLAYLDGAFTEDEGNDPSAMTVWGIFRGEGNLPCAMLTKAWAKRLEMHGEMVERAERESYAAWRRKAEPKWGLVEWVAETCRFRNSEGKVIGTIDKLVIEAKASGITAAQEIRRLYGREGWMTETDVPKADKVTRAHAVVPIFANGQVWAPDREWAEGVIQECEVFPKGRHDDRVDCTTGALRYLRVNGFLVMPDDHHAEEEDRKKLRSVPKALYDV